MSELHHRVVSMHCSCVANVWLICSHPLSWIFTPFATAFPLLPAGASHSVPAYLSVLPHLPLPLSRLQVLDLSRAAFASDMRPSRLSVMGAAARSFIRRFFDLNPLGQLGLAVLRDGVAVKLTDLSGSPEAQVAKLAQFGMDTGEWQKQS